MNFRKRKPTNNPFFLPADQILKIIRFQTVFVDDVEAILSIRDPFQNLLSGLINFLLRIAVATLQNLVKCFSSQCNPFLLWMLCFSVKS